MAEASKHTGTTKGRAKSHKTNKPKFDYCGAEFLQEIETLAAKGFTDRAVAQALTAKFGEALNPTYFSELKNEQDADGSPTERGARISEALTRGRERINLIVRDTYLKTALGGKKVKTIVRRFAEVKCECGGDAACTLCSGTGRYPAPEKPVVVIEESEQELAPNVQALSTWLFNHDLEWRRLTIEGKRLDITSNGKDLLGRIEIVDKTDLVK